LLPAIQQYAEQYPALVFDCSRLTRIDYASALQLHSALQAAAAGRPQNRLPRRQPPGHCAAALLGYANLARIYPHKY
jgi:hypothetical protein